jgi:uncharacterized membrane protein HdeD (DUF308 family)
VSPAAAGKHGDAGYCSGNLEESTMATTAETFASPDRNWTVFRRHWGWLLAFGIVQLIAGILAVAIPALASIVAVAVFGWVMLVSAVFQIVHAVQVRQWQGFALHLLGGLLYAAVGILTLLNPFTGMLALTLLLAGLLLADGILRVVLGVRQRPREGWGWFLTAGIASLVLGILLIVGWPATALWAIGLLLGVNLVFSGVTNAALAMDCRRRQRREHGDTGSEHTPAAAH